MKIVSIHILVVLLLLVVSGCVILPLPTDYYTSGSRTNIDNESIKEIILGKSTMEDVILLLGEPDKVSLPDYCLEYEIEKTNLVTLWMVGGPQAGGAMAGSVFINVGYKLILNFNDQWVVTKKEYRKGTCNTVYGHTTHYFRDGTKASNIVIPFSLFPKVSFPKKIHTVSITINDLRTTQDLLLNHAFSGEYRRRVQLVPSESELIRRVLVKKLHEIQERYGVTPPQEYSVDIERFSFSSSPIFFSTPVDVNIMLTLKYAEKAYQLTGNHQLRDTSATKFQIEFSNSIERALLNLEKDLEAQAPEIFSITEK